MYTTKIAYGLQNNPTAKDIRIAVFVKEQGFVNEFDEREEKSIHLVIFDDGAPVATARAYQKDRSEVYIIGRVAVLPSHRGRGLGAMAVTGLEQFLAGRGVSAVELSAQVQARGFYERLGYTARSEETHMDEHVPHIDMQKSLTPRP